MGGVARVPVAIALGSNLGDRDEQLDEAEDRLAALLSGAVASARYETGSVGGPPNAPDFLNEVVVGTTLLGPRSLLEALHAIEEAAGRERPFVNAPRTLDLDLICTATSSSTSPACTCRIRASATASSCCSRWPKSPATGSIPVSGGPSELLHATADLDASADLNRRPAVAVPGDSRLRLRLRLGFRPDGSGARRHGGHFGRASGEMCTSDWMTVSDFRFQLATASAGSAAGVRRRPFRPCSNIV